MTIECYMSNCRHHGEHDGEEGPFCFMQHCMQSERQMHLLERLQQVYTSGKNKYRCSFNAKHVSLNCYIRADSIQQIFQHFSDIWSDEDPLYSMSLMRVGEPPCKNSPESSTST